MIRIQTNMILEGFLKIDTFIFNIYIRRKRAYELFIYVFFLNIYEINVTPCLISIFFMT